MFGKMLHLLRRIRRSLIQEGHLKKYAVYALGEILLVMLGILLALQVNNMNQLRKDKLSEKQILLELRSEFEINSAKLKTQIGRLKESISGNKIYLDGLLQDTLTAEEIYEYNRGPSITVGTINPNFSVINTIVSTGEIGLVRNDSLRYLITQWTDILGNFVENEELHLNYYFNVMAPYLTETFVRTYSNGHRLHFSHLTDEEVDAINRAGLRQIKYQSFVVMNIDWLSRILNIALETESQLNKITELIDQELQG